MIHNFIFLITFLGGHGGCWFLKMSLIVKNDRKIIDPKK